MAMVSEDEHANNGDIIIDDIYEFSAPKFFDFTREESEEETLTSELWFHTAASHPASPFMHRIRVERSYGVESICDFSEEDHILKFDVPQSSGSTTASDQEQEVVKMPVVTPCEEEPTVCNLDDTAMIRNVHATKEVDELQQEGKVNNKSDELCTPKAALASSSSHKNQVSKKSEKQTSLYAKSQSIPTSKSRFQSSLLKGATKSDVKKRIPNLKSTGTPNLNQEQQAIKKQKLEGGKSKQIPNLKPPIILPHKSKLGASSSSVYKNNKCSSKEERKIYVRETAPSVPFISTAEMMRKFQSSAKEIHTNNNNNNPIQQTKPNKLTLTVPKEPEFETSQRLRLVKMKSTADLEEEQMAKIPKFKARPLNKKILEAPSLAMAQRSIPKPAEFREFHLETATRANQSTEPAPAASADVPHHQQQWKPYLTEPKTPLLHTSIRARAPTVKSSMEMEKEEVEKFPKFKARRLNKKIFESKGELGVFCNSKKQITVPQEFNFATNWRFPPPPSAFTDLFDKLSLNSTEHFVHESSVPRITTPIPFHLQTEERGAEKERRFMDEVMNKQLEEERCRIPKANPYPYTTDYPLIPPKPEPKPCTKQEPFQMESLVRHEKEVQREMEDRQRREFEEAEMRMFKAQPVLKEDLIPVKERVRKPLTEVQEFNLCVDQRATQRAEFDNKVKEKELQYKRHREEIEAATMIEEEKALKHLRRTLIPQARPIPNFQHPFCPQRSSKEMTRAKSPKLLMPQRRQRRRVLSAVASSPAFNMR